MASIKKYYFDYHSLEPAVITKSDGVKLKVFRRVNIKRKRSKNPKRKFTKQIVIDIFLKIMYLITESF